MKNVHLLFIASCVIFASCSKQEFDVNGDTSNRILKTGGTFYHPLHCQLEDGEHGSMCGNDSRDACWEPTPCKPNPQFAIVAAAMYSPQRLKELSNSNASITDPALIEALKKDGILPLK